MLVLWASLPFTISLSELALVSWVQTGGFKVVAALIVGLHFPRQPTVILDQPLSPQGRR